MDFEKRAYSVLCLSSSQNFNNAIKSLLSSSKYQPIVISNNVSDAKRKITERNFDFIIIDSPLSDDNGIRFSIDCCRSLTTVALLIVKADIHDEIHTRVVPYGVFTLPKPTSKDTVLTAFTWLESARERLRRLESKTLSVEERMEEIRIVNRAKLLLVSQLNLSEQEAHQFINKQAMDTCTPKKQVAEKIIKLYSV